MKQSLASDLVSSLSSHIAVLDTNGDIVAVNEQWKRFARENGGNDESFYIGANYLSVCESAVKHDENEFAKALLQGFQDLLQGKIKEFSIEYPCHSPVTEHWFIARIKSFTHEAETYYLASHEEITARKLAEDELREANETIEAMNRELQKGLVREQHKARTDDLTGLNNRRYFFELSEKLFTVAKRYKTDFSVLLFDVDDFKQINDTYGHQVGDTVLKHVAQIAEENTRDSDILARYGGEEFIIALPNTNARGAYTLAENIRNKIASFRDSTEDNEINVTISTGVAEISSTHEKFDQLIQEADEAMYYSKNSGRNRSSIYPPVPITKLRK